MARPVSGHPRKMTPTNIPLPKPSIATAYTTATVPLRGLHNDENTPPSRHKTNRKHMHKNSFDIAASKVRAKSGPGPLAALPKSNTMNVLSNLTSSLSRNSLVRFSRSTSVSSTADSETSISVASDSPVDLTSSEVMNPREVRRAQASEYWTGRFVALQDRFHNELLLPENMTTLITTHAERSTLPDCAPPTSKNMPVSASSSSLHPNARGHSYSTSDSTAASKDKLRDLRYSMDATLLVDEGNRAKRAFLHLEAMCTTSEARRSLHTWQQRYARRVKRADLLPRGGSMEDKGWMGRLLGRDATKRNSVGSIA